MKIIIYLLKQLFPLTYWEKKKRCNETYLFIWKQWFGIKWNYETIRCPIDVLDFDYIPKSEIITQTNIEYVNSRSVEIAKELRDKGINNEELAMRFCTQIYDKWMGRI